MNNNYIEKINDNHSFRKWLLTLVIVFVGGAFTITNAQTRITGTVTEEGTNEPMTGATVQVKGMTSTATMTDLDGHYAINVPEGAKTLVFSFTGMKTQEVAINGRTEINVTLSDEGGIQLTTVDVISDGFRTTERKMFTGSAAKVAGDDAKVDGGNDVSKMLQGKAAGVQVVDVSGTFGAAPKLKVRGPSSIYGNSTPLWVLNGVVLDEIVNIDADDLASGNAETLISSGVAGINPDDIESIQILKDASATALYGARAMNGVIVITTKKGHSGQASFNYTGEFTSRLKPSYSQYDILNSKDQMGVLLEMEQKGLMADQSMFLVQDGGVFNKMYQLIDQYTNAGFGLAYTEQARMKYLQDAEMRNTNWLDEQFRYALKQQHSISMSVGTEKATARFSASFLNDPGWTPVDNVNRWTFNASGNYNFSPKVILGLSGNATWRNQKAPGTLQRQINPVEGEYSRDFDINPFSYALNTSRTMAAHETYRRNYAPFNIFNEMENNYMDLNQTDVTIQADLTYKPIDKQGENLTINVLGSHRFAKITRTHNVKDNSNMAMAYRAYESSDIINNNNFLWTDPDNPSELPVVVLPIGGFYNTYDNSLVSYYGRLTGNYNLVKETYALNLFAGGEIRSVDRLTRNALGYGYLWASEMAVTDNRIIRKILDAGDSYFGMQQEYDRSMGFFATGTGSYKGRYTLNATIRTEGSNQMGKSAQARWLPTWNISGAWDIRSESFMKNKMEEYKLDWISTLRLRATYGLTAKMISGVNADIVYTAFSTFRPFQYDREVGFYYENLANKELTWEKSYETNIGLDLGLIKNRVSLIFDVYWKNNFDIIGYMRNPGFGGESIKIVNYADLKSNGFEFSLNTINIHKEDSKTHQTLFQWSNNFIFSYNQNKIQNMEDGVMRLYQLVGLDGAPRNGYPVRGLFSIPFAGLDEDGAPTYFDQNGDRVYYIDLQEQQNLSFLKYEGPIDPKVTGGVENSLRYKNFQLDLYFTYQWGNVIRLYPTFSYWYSDMDAMTKEMRNRWTLPGDEKITNIPSIPSLDMLRNNNDLIVAYNAYNFSDLRVAKGDFIRLKDITLSYIFDRKLIDSFKIGLRDLSVKFVASNMWLIYSDKRLNGQDPEFQRSGGVAMPTPKQFTLSIRAGF